ncbi:CAP domain-containing protein [Jeotgalibacillus sp. ET6]|uniref:CAP domain-containing protein n=1 Tax=Jeotgalibacillus sp. ET6 TaxID=3037260 RepID=UPI0024184F54|nr:CAP domain-containing protein [Jeotgalibacillus sp. ET6]MDG5470560.1 CAP domain-containing protein [Jeotgalibacillus sp. ET6]
MKGKSLIISGAAAIALLVSPAASQASSADVQQTPQKHQNIEVLTKLVSQNLQSGNLRDFSSQIDWEKINTELQKYNISLNEFNGAPAQADQPAKEEAAKKEAPAAPAPEKQTEAPKAQQPAEQEAPQEAAPAPAQPAEEQPAAEVQDDGQADQQEASPVSDFEQQVVDLTNAERSKEGLPALELDTELSKVADDKSLDMQQNQYFSHTSPTHGSPFDMMKAYGIEYSSAGENIAMGQRSPEEVVQAWMNSEGHRKNIMSSSFTHIGVGHVEEGNYWTQMFISK